MIITKRLIAIIIVSFLNIFLYESFIAQAYICGYILSYNVIHNIFSSFQQNLSK